MNRSCLYCHDDLGTNEVSPTHPVGRRVAFDRDRGRLWAICTRCGRWNLSPIDRRWESIEELAQAYDEAELRFDDDGIGIALLGDTEIVEAGSDGDAGISVARYGAYFEARHGSWQRVTTALQKLSVGFLLLTTWAGGMAWGFWGAWFTMITVMILFVVFFAVYNPLLTNIPTSDGDWKKIRYNDVVDLRLVPDDSEEGWYLLFRDGTEIRGREALHAMALLLPPINEQVYGRHDVRMARGYLKRKGSTTNEVFAAAARRWGEDKTAPVSTLDPHIRLALEIVAHEEAERVEAAGTLAILKRQWEQAEAMAAIADGLALPRGVEASLDRLTKGASS